MITAKRACHCCKGTGEEIDQRALGEELRRRRQLAKLSLAKVARGLRISAPYLSDLERGNRHWSDDLKAKFLEIVSV